MIKNFLTILVWVLSIVFIASPVSGRDRVIPERIAVVPPTGVYTVMFIDAIEELNDRPGEILFVCRNKGAYCGGGTPATVWKLILDPISGEFVSMELKHTLTRIQITRNRIFDDSDGRVFTASGWCGYKPPYCSLDYGETWRSEDYGPVHPPNSTFSYIRYFDDILVGTGYHPYLGEVYRWLGNGNWERVLSIPPPRSYVVDMAVDQGCVFVAACIYWPGGSGWESSTAVYRSWLNYSFHATEGIPASYSAKYLMHVQGKFLALAVDYFNPTQRYVYRWDCWYHKWILHGECTLDVTGIYDTAVTDGIAIYDYGKVPGSSQKTICRSEDLGQTWEVFAVLDSPPVSALHYHNGSLYAGTYSDSANNAYIYRCRLPLRALKVVSPNDGEVWVSESPNTIYWHESDIRNCLQVILLKNDRVLGYINPRVKPGIGKLDWNTIDYYAGTVKLKAEPDKDYKIKIVEIGGDQEDCSDTDFEIVDW